MFTKRCYRTIELKLGFGAMFSRRLEQSCHYHSVIVEEIGQSILDWGVPIKEAVPVLLGLGYTSNQVSDGIRYLRETAKELKVPMEAEYNSVEVELVEDEAEAA